MNRTLSLALVALLVGLVVSTGAAAAQASSSSIIDEEVSIDNDTQSVWYEVVANESMSGETLNATVTFEGLESGQDAGNGTELTKTDFEITTGGEALTGSYSLADGDADTYDRIRVYVNGSTDADADLVASTDYGYTSKVSGGGGGGLLGVSGGSTAVVALILLGGAVVVLRGDD